MLIVSQLKGASRQGLCGILEVEDLEGLLDLQMVWQILDQAHGKLAHERLDEAYAAMDRARANGPCTPTGRDLNWRRRTRMW